MCQVFLFCLRWCYQITHYEHVKSNSWTEILCRQQNRDANNNLGLCYTKCIHGFKVCYLIKKNTAVIEKVTNFFD